MPNLARLPTRAGDELVHVVVETPRGARAKLTFDPELKTFVLSKALMLGLSYPYDWGASSRRPEPRTAIRSTPWSFTTRRPRRGSCCAASSLACCRRCKKPSTTESATIGVIAVPENSHRERELHGIQELPPALKQELEKFFVATDELEAKTLRFLGWQGPAQAKKLVRRCEKVFKKKN